MFQELTIRALRTRDCFPDEGGLLSWARVTARNLALDHARRQKRYDRVLGELALEAVEARLETALDSWRPRAEAMRHCVERLPPKSRQLLRLR